MEYIKSIERKAIEDKFMREIVSDENPRPYKEISATEIEQLDAYKKNMYYNNMSDEDARKLTRESVDCLRDGADSDPDSQYYKKSTSLEF